jgi:phenylalanyl-tRNA synthetase beta chain
MYQGVERFPAIVRDVSFFVDDFVPAARVREVVAAAREPLLRELAVLEDYREPGKVPQGKKGMLWSMTYRAADRTLTDAEVDAAHERLVAKLLAAVNAQRR